MAIRIIVLSLFLGTGVLSFGMPSASASWLATLDTGVQLDYLRWNISAPANGPNILSELTFKTISPMGRLTLGWFPENQLWWM